MSEPLDYSGSPSVQPRRHFGWLAVGGTVLAVAVLVSLLLPLLERPRHGPGHNRVQCLSRLRQVGLAIKMYANDHRGVLPPDLATAVAFEDCDPHSLFCPSSSDAWVSYPATAPATTRAILDELRKPGRCSSYVLAVPPGTRDSSLSPRHVLAYERPDNHAEDGVRDGGGMNVLYGDGMARWVPAAQARRLVAELNAGHNPPRP